MYIQLIDMTNGPLVSVIVPNYNYAQYLAGRFDSILNQTLGDFELIVLDDASTDGSMEVIERYAGDGCVAHVVRNETNSGSPFAQWRHGLELARGKYVWIAEADDLAVPELLERAVGALEATPEGVLAFVGCHTIDENGDPGAEDYDNWKECPRKLEGGYEAFDGKEYLRRNLYWQNYIYNASGAVFRREAVRMGVFDEIRHMRHSGDWYFWADLVSRGRVVEVYEKLNRMRRHSSSVTQKGVARRPLDIITQDLENMAYVERLTEISAYRRAIRRGVFLKRLGRSPLPKEVKREARRVAREIFGANLLHYLFERVNKPFAPVVKWVVTREKDRL